MEGEQCCVGSMAAYRRLSIQWLKACWKTRRLVRPQGPINTKPGSQTILSKGKDVVRWRRYIPTLACRPMCSIFNRKTTNQPTNQTNLAMQGKANLPMDHVRDLLQSLCCVCCFRQQNNQQPTSRWKETQTLGWIRSRAETEADSSSPLESSSSKALRTPISRRWRISVNPWSGDRQTDARVLQFSCHKKHILGRTTQTLQHEYHSSSVGQGLRQLISPSREATTSFTVDRRGKQSA